MQFPDGDGMLLSRSVADCGKKLPFICKKEPQRCFSVSEIRQSLHRSHRKGLIDKDLFDRVQKHLDNMPDDTHIDIGKHH
jgi:hypothetical protein